MDDKTIGIIRLALACLALQKTNTGHSKRIEDARIDFDNWLDTQDQSDVLMTTELL